MDEVVYAILARVKDTFNIIYMAESDKTTKADFFTSNDKFKCWITHAGNEDNLYLSIYPMWDSEKAERERIVNKAISRYQPVCNTN
jgi:hypothetical protein